MQVGGNVNTLMQTVMAMRSPELMARMPEIEAMAWEERVALVNRGHYNINQLIKGWDKFGDLMIAQGWTKQQVKQKAKALKNARQKLEMGMRLADPKKIPKPFETQAHAAFDVLAAWFLMDAGSLETVLLGPRIEKGGISSLVAPVAPASAVSADVHELEDLPAGLDDDVTEVNIVDVEMEGSDTVGSAPDEVVDRVKDAYID